MIKRPLCWAVLATPLMGLSISAALAGSEPAHAPTTAPAEEPGLLSPDLGSAVWTIVLFVVLVLILGKFVWPPILKGLQAREAKIKGDLDHAEQSAQQAAATLKEYQASLAQAQEEARKVIEQARKDAQGVADQVKTDTQTEINQMRQRAQTEIRVAKEQALTDIYTQTAALATSVAGKILQREINPADQHKLVQQSLDEMQKASRN